MLSHNSAFSVVHSLVHSPFCPVALPWQNPALTDDSPANVYRRTLRLSLAALAILRSALGEGAYALSITELRWLNRPTKQGKALPEDEDKPVDSMKKRINSSKDLLKEYGL